MIKKTVYLCLLLTIFLSGNYHSALAADTNSFQVLVDINQIYPSEAEQAAKFAADGVWTIPLNSSGVDWSTTFDALNANKWIVSEDNPGSTSQVDYVSSIIGRMVDGAMFYNEDNTSQIISDAEIEALASHVVPGFGPLGDKIIVLSRNYTNLSGQLNHALENPHVAGAAFEFNPGYDLPPYRFDAGCKHILDLEKKCYLLIAPDRPSTNYLGNTQKVTNYFAEAGLLNNPDVYFVLAVYVRDTTKVHFLSTTPNDPNSIESVVKWLNAYRNYSPTPTPTSTPTPPHGTVQGCKVLSGKGCYDPANAPFTLSGAPVSLDGIKATNLGNSAPNSYNFGATSGTHIVTATAPTGYKVIGYTLCYNRTDCHQNTPTPGSSVNIDVPVNGYVDLWWHFTLPGDINADGSVDIKDYNKMVADFGHPYTIFDYNVLVGNFGK